MGRLLTVKAERGIKRFVQIEPGAHSIGSGLSCDVLLSDPPFLPVHLMVYVGAVSVKVRVLADGPPTQLRCLADGNTVTLVRGRSASWHAGWQLWIAGVCLEIVDLSTSYEVPCRETIKRSRSFCYIAVAIICAVIITAVKGLDKPIFLTEGTEHIKNGSLAAEVEILNEAILRKRISSMGVSLEKLEVGAVRWSAKVRLGNESERAAAIEQFSALDTFVDFEFVLDSHLMSAVELILKGLGVNAEIVSLDRGVLILKYGAEDKLSKAFISETILNDIPDILDIRYSEPDSIGIEDIQRNIEAVWLGKRPYVAVKNGGIVHVGKDIAQGIRLIDVNEQRILVDVGGAVHPLHIP
ncbi:SctD/MshK family protein [Brucella anthropi]|uniref:SctD/MshK family protein n=1 Tax=Brucella anthropi TaxID=529 RepID=UPI00384F3B51